MNKLWQSAERRPPSLSGFSFAMSLPGGGGDEWVSGTSASMRVWKCSAHVRHVRTCEAPALGAPTG